MRICLIGDFSKNLDEGAKNVLYYLNKELSIENEIIQLDEKKIFTLKFIKILLLSKKPDIIHFFTDPTTKGLFFLKCISKYWGNTITVVSALNPKVYTNTIDLWRILKPNLILVQSLDHATYFQKMFFNTEILPNGVDLQKFNNFDIKVKSQLRKKYDIKEDSFVVLHIGHIKKNRHLELFEQIQKNIAQVIIIGSNYITVDKNILKNLTKGGCIIKIGYIERIQDYYLMSDCYVFPVEPEGAITTPLSVLESMACNIPVVSRKFPGLCYLFNEGNGFYFAETDEEFILKIMKIKEGVKSNTRNKIMSLSWSEISNQLIILYKQLLNSIED